MIAILVAALTLDPCAIFHARVRLPALLVRRGMPTGDAEMGFITYVVPDPGGLIVIDPAVSASTPQHLERLPLLARLTMPDFSHAPRVGEVLGRTPVRAVLV